MAPAHSNTLVARLWHLAPSHSTELFLVVQGRALQKLLLFYTLYDRCSDICNSFSSRYAIAAQIAVPALVHAMQSPFRYLYQLLYTECDRRSDSCTSSCTRCAIAVQIYVPAPLHGMRSPLRYMY
ncbi:hypothetical protein J6590_068763 [Homalodisca vitripennis]|nr:hypothetical protein J6590_068763 [Homalodisca vitripennis]